MTASNCVGGPHPQGQESTSQVPTHPQDARHLGGVVGLGQGAGASAAPQSEASTSRQLPAEALGPYLTHCSEGPVNAARPFKSIT